MRLTNYFARSKWVIDEDIYDYHNEKAIWLDLQRSMSWETGPIRSVINERSFSLLVVDETVEIHKDGEKYITGYINGVCLPRPTDDPDFDPTPPESGSLEHSDNLPSGIRPGEPV